MEIPSTTHSSCSCQATPDVKDATVECCITKGVAQLEAANASLKQKLSRVIKQKRKLATENKRLKTKSHRQKVVSTALEELYSPAQVRHILKRKVKFVRNYSKEDITRALVLKAISNKAYKFPRSQQIMALPSRVTLSKWLQDFKCVPGMQRDCLWVIKEKLLQSSDSPHENLVVISFDEMELKQKYEYHRETKKIFGPCKKLQAALIRGLTHNWKQLVYFDFDVLMTRSVFESIIQEVEDSGAEVCAVTFDLGNKTFLSAFGLTEEKHWIMLNEERKIFAVPDPCHMLKLA